MRFHTLHQSRQAPSVISGQSLNVLFHLFFECSFQNIVRIFSKAFNDCKQCKNKVTTENCDANTMIVKPTKLQTAPANLFTICMAINNRDFTCKLVSSTRYMKLDFQT